jgi:hypothetical protein
MISPFRDIVIQQTISPLTRKRGYPLYRLIHSLMRRLFSLCVLFSNLFHVKSFIHGEDQFLRRLLSIFIHCRINRFCQFNWQRRREKFSANVRKGRQREEQMREKEERHRISDMKGWLDQDDGSWKHIHICAVHTEREKAMSTRMRIWQCMRQNQRKNPKEKHL